MASTSPLERLRRAGLPPSAALFWKLPLKRRPVRHSFTRRRKYGADRDRTGDLMNAIHALYQLSYSPKIISNSKGTPVHPEFSAKQKVSKDSPKIIFNSKKKPRASCRARRSFLAKAGSFLLPVRHSLGDDGSRKYRRTCTAIILRHDQKNSKKIHTSYTLSIQIHRIKTYKIKGSDNDKK